MGGARARSGGISGTWVGRRRRGSPAPVCPCASGSGSTTAARDLELVGYIAAMSDWSARLEPVAPDIVAAWRGIEAEQFLSVRREVRRRAGVGTAMVIVEQLEGLAASLGQIGERPPDGSFPQPCREA